MKVFTLKSSPRFILHCESLDGLSLSKFGPQDRPVGLAKSACFEGHSVEIPDEGYHPTLVASGASVGALLAPEIKHSC
jgi:hypothetical protein